MEDTGAGPGSSRRNLVAHHASRRQLLRTGALSAGTQSGTFRLTVSHDTLTATDVLDNLTMHTVEERVKQAWPTQNLLTVRDLRPEESAGEPAAGSFTMSSQMCIFAVHTGMITYPIAWAGRLILDDPQLSREPDLRQKAEAYVLACKARSPCTTASGARMTRGKAGTTSPEAVPSTSTGLNSRPASFSRSPVR